MVKHLGLFGTLLLSLAYPMLISPSSQVLGAQAQKSEVLPFKQPIHTISEFSTKLITTTITLPKETIIKETEEKELDDDTVLDEGENGKKVTTYTVTYYKDEEYSREVTSVDITPPKDKVISHGTKIVWRDFNSGEGTITYWRKLHVFATDYDSHCFGCNEWTATGMRQGKGVIAVDPKVIRLGTKLYIPGYGIAIAGDTGGAVKGNIIDLGFEDARVSGWVSHSLDIYLISR